MGMGNISGGELMILVFLALLLIGPEKLPQYAQQLAKLVRTLKEMMSGAKETLKDELGDDFEELQKFDPRQYDPRRIVRDALNDPAPARRSVPTSAPAQSAAGFTATSAAGTTLAGGAALAGAAVASQEDGTMEEVTEASAEPAAPPFDDEAT